MTLRVVLFREGPCWLAQCLDRDFGAQGSTLSETLGRLAVVATELERTGAMATLGEAPPYFQTLWPLHAGIFQPARDVLGQWSERMTFGVAA